MKTLLVRIGIAALLSTTSFVVILFRVSPLASPTIAVPAFFLTLFLALSSIASLIFYAVWTSVKPEGMDAGRRMSVALREALFLASASCIVLLLQIAGVAVWWIIVLTYAVFILVEVALLS